MLYVSITKTKIKSNLKFYLRLLQNNFIYIKHFFKTHDIQYTIQIKYFISEINNNKHILCICT